MKRRAKMQSLRELFEQARRHPEYSVEGASLEFAEQIVCVMRARGIDQKELGKRLGVTQQYVGQMLRGRNLTIASMARVAHVLGYGVRIILYEMPIPPKQIARRSAAANRTNRQPAH